MAVTCEGECGVQFNYNMMHVAGYGNDGAVGFEVASQWRVNSALVTGIHIVNPAGGRFRNHAEEKLAAVYQFGAGYEVSKQLFLSAELTKEEDRPVNVQAGLQYMAVPDKLFLRTGITDGYHLTVCRTGLAMEKLPRRCKCSVSSASWVFRPACCYFFMVNKKQNREVALVIMAYGARVYRSGPGAAGRTGK